MGIRDKLEVLQWTDSIKCLVISIIAIVFSFFYLGFVSFFISNPEVLPHFNKAFLEFAILVLPPVLLSWVVIAIWSFAAIKKNLNPVPLVYITLLWYGIPNVFLVYGLGPLTNPFVGIALLGTAIVSILIFSIKPALVTFLAVIVAVVVLTILERLEIIPYAPLLEIEPTINGRPADLWVVSFGLISLLMILAIVGAFVYITVQLRAREKELEMLSNTDSLTGLNNRRYFTDIANQEFSRAQRSGRALTVMMCDADHFKRVNDTWGHQVGDEVLKFIASVLKKNSRQGIDFIGRLGGEEFAIISVETDEQQAIHLAERILLAMRQHTFNSGTEDFQVTMSIGLAVINKEVENVEVLMDLADKRLYQAKNNGRDRLVSNDLTQ